MINYNILELENMPEVLKSKPRWVACMALAIGILLITLSAVAIGVVIGYTYCYFEHRSIIKTGNITQSTNFQIFQMPLVESLEAKKNRTINGAISSVFITRLLKIGQALMDDDTVHLPWSRDHPSSYMFQ
ncbi:hypothetical protein K1T71_007698 [Dendrolimus kikuchii]|uniref:Uncharacterized protein n=1 Tax=Dendrolimus kikuchii TaxID=765133 RepID=A0ACC1CXQ7_9NEOP|nr:hypothetical protein K1T71_007698 [Dendrolimus kikuchii]